MIVNLADRAPNGDAGPAAVPSAVPSAGSERRCSRGMIRAVDTVEWGSDRGLVDPLDEQRDREPDGTRSPRGPLRIGSWWTATALAAGGLAAMMASELLPWATLHISSPSGTDLQANSASVNGTMTFGLDRLRSFDVYAYQTATLAVLALLGALLFGRVRQRRALFGMGAGLLAAQALTLAGMIHSFGHLLDDYLGIERPSIDLHTTVEPGAYFAAVGLILLLACLVMTAAPERVRAQLSEVMREPVDAEFTDEPIELTVTQAKPIDESYFMGPDHRR